MLQSVIWLLAFALALAVGIRLWRLRSAVRTSQTTALELQAFLTSCVDELKELLAREGVSGVDIQREAEVILAKMQTRNLNGELDAFIQDSRDAVRQEINGRNAA
jgi:hypothetical protein